LFRLDVPALGSALLVALVALAIAFLALTIGFFALTIACFAIAILRSALRGATAEAAL